MFTIIIWLASFISLTGMIISISFNLSHYCLIINIIVFLLSCFIHTLIYDYIYPKYLSVKLYKTTHRYYNISFYNNKYYFKDLNGKNKKVSTSNFFKRINSTKVKRIYIQEDVYALSPKNKLYKLLFIFPNNKEVSRYTLYLPM